MAKFTVKKVKEGNDKKGFKYYDCIAHVEAEEGDSVILIPEEIDGVTITHVGYRQEYTPAHEHWHDWHHPAQGSEWVEEKYSLGFSTILLPDFVKKIIIPKTVVDFCNYAFDEPEDLIVETVEDHPTLCVKNNKVCKK